MADERETACLLRAGTVLRVAVDRGDRGARRGGERGWAVAGGVCGPRPETGLVISEWSWATGSPLASTPDPCGISLSQTQQTV